MRFGQPWFLLGTLAALIPLIVHLFDRRKPRPQPLPTFAFVLRSQKRTASRLKLKKILLYLLRTAILLAIPVALAKPELDAPARNIQARRGLAATAIVLDASLSMRYRSGETLFDKAQEEARAAVRALAPEEPATFLLCGTVTPSPLSQAQPTFDRALLRNAIDDARVGYGVADISQCMEWAARSLEQSALPGKRLVVISDFAAHGLHLDSPPLSGLDVVLRPVTPESTPSNHALVGLQISPLPNGGPRSFQLTLTARSFSSEAEKGLEAAVRVGDRVVAKGFLDLPPGGTAVKTLQHRFEAPPDNQSSVSGEVTLTPDSLEVDDRRAFVLAVPRDLKALIINGSPQPVRHEDEAFFTEAALTAAGSPVQVTVRDGDAGLRETLTHYDLVLLLNAPAPDEATAARLKSFVEAGGGLFISVGDAVDPDAYNRRLGAILPRTLRLVRTAAAREEPESARKAARLGQVAWSHPVFSLFQGPAREGLLAARFFRYLLLESERGQPRQGSAETLATYDDGSPALAAARVGRGRVLLFTSTVDRDWSDFAIRTSFLPLMQRFSAYLCGALEEHAEVQGRVGGEVALKPERGELGGSVSRVTVPVDSGGESTLPVRLQPDGTAHVGPLPAPGIYRPLDGRGLPLPNSSFAASTDPRESDLTRVPPSVLERYFGQDAVTLAGGQGARQSTPGWTWLVVLAALAFIGEGVVLKSFNGSWGTK